MKKAYINKIVLGGIAAALTLSSCNNVLNEVNRETYTPEQRHCSGKLRTMDVQMGLHFPRVFVIFYHLDEVSPRTA